MNWARKRGEFRVKVLRRLLQIDRICREEFLENAGTRTRARREQLRILNSIFQHLVVTGILFTVDRGGDYTFFKHHGRAFPKLWRRRASEEAIRTALREIEDKA